MQSTKVVHDTYHGLQMQSELQTSSYDTAIYNANDMIAQFQHYQTYGAF